MRSTVRARVKGGMLELLENIDLPEGAEVTVTILTNLNQRPRGLPPCCWRLKDTVDADTLIKNIYESRLLSTRPVPKL